MSKIMNFQKFLSEALTMTSDELSEIDDMADNINWKEGDKFAFIDFNGIKDIPISISINNKKSRKEKSEKI